MKLSQKQRECLAELAKGERSAYPGLNLGTLNSLALRGLVKDRTGRGSIFSPATGIKWRLTEAGRAALENAS